LEILEDFPDIKNELLNAAKEKREKYYEVIISRKLPVPVNTLDVYGLNDLNQQNEKKEAAIAANKIASPKAKAESKFKPKQKKKSGNKEEVKVVEKTKLHIFEDEIFGASTVDPLKNTQLEKVEAAMEK